MTVSLEIYQPECPYSGPQDPLYASHLGIDFSIPRKCADCEFNLEGQCKLMTNRLARMDYGYCGIKGAVHLVEDPRARRRIPHKCVKCPHLGTHSLIRLICTKDRDTWGELGRGLDYTGKLAVDDRPLREAVIDADDEVELNGLM